MGALASMLKASSLVSVFAGRLWLTLAPIKAVAIEDMAMRRAAGTSARSDWEERSDEKGPKFHVYRDKSLLESWATIFLPD